MTSRVVALCLDAADPVALARFWGVGLRWDVGELDEDGGVVLTPTDHTPFTVECYPSPDVKHGQNRIHLDLTTSSRQDYDDTIRELLAAGARHVDVGQRPDEPHTVLADPEGNELCIIEPGNNFLAGCERIGAINCDGTRRVGQFWSAALGWPLVWDQDEETAIRAPDGTGPLITWSGPPLKPKRGKNRLHLDLASVEGDQHGEVERLIALGASRVDIGQGDAPWVVLADPDDNEFCVLGPHPTGPD